MFEISIGELMASYTFTLTGNENVLSSQIYPPINLSDERYAIGLVSFSSYHSIPNVSANNNKFVFEIPDEFIGDDNNNMSDREEVVIESTAGAGGMAQDVIEVPVGAYEIKDVESYLKKKIEQKYPKLKGVENVLSIEPNLNTQHISIKSSYLNINFVLGTLGSVLGFSSRSLLAGPTEHVSDKLAQVSKIHSIRIDCNIVTGSYYNGKQSHVIFEFPLQVPPGYSIIEVPRNIIYLPITSNQIDNITLQIVDQDGEPIDFRGEKIVVRLELKRL